MIFAYLVHCGVSPSFICGLTYWRAWHNSREVLLTQ